MDSRRFTPCPWMDLNHRKSSSSRHPMAINIFNRSGPRMESIFTILTLITALRPKCPASISPIMKHIALPIRAVSPKNWWIRLIGPGYRGTAPGWPMSRSIRWMGRTSSSLPTPMAPGAYQVTIAGQYVPPIIDAPVFTVDDKLILYSAVYADPIFLIRAGWIKSWAYRLLQRIPFHRIGGPSRSAEAPLHN